MFDQFLYFVFKCIPANFLSWVTGILVRIRFPKAIQVLLNRSFVGVFRIDMGEAARPTESYESIEELFTRSLGSGARPIAGNLCSPADGKLVVHGRSESDQAVQVKGIYYSLSTLIGRDLGEERSQDLKLCEYFTIYLAPHNYHRVHSPLSGELRKIQYIPGGLWPVNERFTRLVPSLFTKNERMVFELRPQLGGRAWIVMVGAFNVGRITSPFWPTFSSNGASRQFQQNPQSIATNRQIAAGEEIGTFMLGSTVVVVLDQDCSSALGGKSLSFPRPVVMGEKFW